MKKRTIITLLIIIILLVGCGKKDEITSNNTNQENVNIPSFNEDELNDFDDSELIDYDIEEETN